MTAIDAVFIVVAISFSLSSVWELASRRKTKATVSYDTKPERKSDLQTLLEHLQASELRYHARISELLSAMQARGDADNGRIASLIGTLDKIVTAEYDQPTVTYSHEPTVTASPFPHSALSDILEIEDDAEFVERAEEIQE